MTQPHVHDWPTDGRDGMTAGPATCGICGESLTSFECGWAAEGLMPRRRIYARELIALSAEAAQREPEGDAMPALLQALRDANHRHPGETEIVLGAERRALLALLAAANERGVTLSA